MMKVKVHRNIRTRTLVIVVKWPRPIKLLMLVNYLSFTMIFLYDIHVFWRNGPYLIEHIT